MYDKLVLLEQNITISEIIANAYANLKDSGGSSHKQRGETSSQSSSTRVGGIVLGSGRSRGGGGGSGGGAARVQDVVAIGIHGGLQRCRQRRHERSTARAAFFHDEVLSSRHSLGHRRASRVQLTALAILAQIVRAEFPRHQTSNRGAVLVHVAGRGDVSSLAALDGLRTEIKRVSSTRGAHRAREAAHGHTRRVDHRSAVGSNYLEVTINGSVTDSSALRRRVGGHIGHLDHSVHQVRVVHARGNHGVRIRNDTAINRGRVSLVAARPCSAGITHHSVTSNSRASLTNNSIRESRPGGRNRHVRRIQFVHVRKESATDRDGAGDVNTKDCAFSSSQTGHVEHVLAVDRSTVGALLGGGDRLRVGACK